MTLEAQRIAIARYVGWKPHTPAGFDWSDVPDYLNSLDAIHEAEKVLTIQQRVQWHFNICEIVKASSPMKCANGYADVTFQLCHATAAQRAEAFLKTLNLWTP